MKALLGTENLRKLTWCCVALCLGGTAVACGDDDSEPSDEEDAGAESGSGGRGGRSGSSAAGRGGAGGSAGTAGRGGSGSAGRGGAGGSDGDAGGPAEECDPSKKETEVDADITSNTTWECGTYVLTKIIYVTGNSTLTIKPGVQVLGSTDSAGVVTALIVTSGSKLDASGTKDQPIVFTSGNPAGARSPGDWGGVVLLGKATINSGSCVGGSGDACTGGHLETNVEGLDATDTKSKYGGTDDAHSCGTLQYVRVEYAGYQLSMDNELNGITVAGCGTGTKLSYIQVHRGSDDGIEFFGGTAGFDHVVLSAESDDALDWDLGWRGKGQFLVVHQASNDGDKGFEADNLGSKEDAAPRSKPTLYNATLIGNPTKVGMLLREGTRGVFRNFIVQGFATAVDVAALQVNASNDWPGELSIESSVFFDVDAVGDGDSDDDDMGFNEDEAIKNGERKNVFDVDPKLGNASITAPDYKPASTDLGGKATPPSGFDSSATYAGALNPSGDDWTKGWTEFSED